MKNSGIVLNESYGIGESKIYVKKSYGSRVVDTKENTYIDTAMGGGTFLLGHRPKVIENEIIKQLKKGSLYTIANPIVYKLATLLDQVIPNLDRFVFCSTGSEATLRAIRIARSYTKREKIAIFSGSWHGSHDLLLVDESYSGDEFEVEKVLKSSGTLKSTLDDVLVLPYNCERAFEIIEANKDDIAMVLIEPSQGSNPRDDVGEFLKKLREVTLKCDILLGFDEIITGFRVALGGAQEYYGVDADLATYAKTAGGGLPFAIVGGKAKYMSAIKDNGIFMGGTFSANPLSVSSSYAMLKYLSKNREKVYTLLSKNGEYLKTSVNEICKKYNANAHMIGINSMLRFVFSAHKIKSRFQRDAYEIDQAKQKLFYENMRVNHKIYIASNRINFLSTKHTKKDLDLIINAYEVEIERFCKLGYL